MPYRGCRLQNCRARWAKTKWGNERGPVTKLQQLFCCQLQIGEMPSGNVPRMVSLKNKAVKNQK